VREICGKPVSIADDVDGTIKVITSMRTGDKLVQQEEACHEDFIAHLQSFGGEWMWEQLDIGDDLTWLAKAIQEGTAVAVTDGSYNKKTCTQYKWSGVDYTMQSDGQRS